jgi:hypothetical protein
MSQRSSLIPHLSRTSMRKLAALLALGVAFAAPGAAQADTPPDTIQPVDFGSVPVGTTAQQTLTVVGGYTITGFQWQYAGATYDYDFKGVFSIDPASTCQVGQLNEDVCKVVIDAQAPVAQDVAGDEFDALLSNGTQNAISQRFVLSANFADVLTVDSAYLGTPTGDLPVQPSTTIPAVADYVPFDPHGLCDGDTVRVSGCVSLAFGADGQGIPVDVTFDAPTTQYPSARPSSLARLQEAKPSMAPIR